MQDKQQESLVGKIFYSSWGYSMTIIDWYVVVRETPSTAIVAQIEGEETSTGYLSGTTVPKKPFKFITQRDGKKELRVVKRDGFLKGKLDGSIMHYLYQWDGVTPKHFNHCD